MNHRHLACALLSAVCAAVAPLRADEPVAKPDRPHIVFILADDLGKEWIGCYGAEAIKTPRIDALAAGGMRFENAYCMPQCTPTRVTLLTGQYPFRHGWTNHWDVPRWGAGGHFDPSMNPSLPRVLREAGYATVAAGKWQIDDFRVEPNAMHEAGFDDWCMWTGYEADNPPSDNRYFDPYVYRKGKPSQTIAGKFGPDVYCDYLIDFMRTNRDAGKPMFVYYAMALPHGPATATPDEPDATGAPARHKAMVRYIDTLVGRLVDAIDELSMTRNTIVIFATDNGTGGFVGRRLGRDVPGAKAKMVEAGTAVPFIVRGPGRVPAGVTTDALTDFTDLLPTFADLAGAAMPTGHRFDGRSIAPVLLGKAADTGREWVLSMGGGPAKLRDGRVVPAQPYDDRVLRDKRFKVWVDTHGRIVKLYDMPADPWEQRNLIDSTDPEHVAAIEKFRAVVVAFPERDAAPRYTPNPPQKWDLKPDKRAESE